MTNPGDAAPAQGRSVGASPLTLRIYRAVLKAGRPVTAAEIYEQMKDLSAFRTDTSQWWKRIRAKRLSYQGGSLNNLSVAEIGLRRVGERIKAMVTQGVLISDRQRPAEYTPGRPPKGFRRHLHPGERFGWHDYDVSAEDQKLADRQALYELRQAISAELKGKLTARMRRLLAEADRLLAKVTLQ